ncbi:hotdog fold thioesterase [Halorientalis persicus]
MDITDIMEHIPFARHLGIDVIDAEEGYAKGQLELTNELSSNPGHLIAHGGVAFALADTVGGAAVVSLNHTVTPTIDMRIDYLNPATTDLIAEAEVIRNGDSVAVAEVDVRDKNDTEIASARGIYKTGDHDGESAWTDSENITSFIEQ